MQKIPRIDLNRVRSLFKSLNNEKGILGIQLLDEIQFMKTTLKKLKDEVVKKGVVTEMSQGDYKIDRANPAISQYTTMVKNYNAAIKQVVEMLPQNENFQDGFDDF